MSLWKRLSLVFMIGSFPIAIYYFSSVALSIPKKKKNPTALRRAGEKNSDIALVEMNRGIEAKAKELREIDVRILENKGTILKLEEDRQAFVNNLEEIQAQLSSVIKGVKNHSTSSR